MSSWSRTTNTEKTIVLFLIPSRAVSQLKLYTKQYVLYPIIRMERTVSDIDLLLYIYYYAEADTIITTQDKSTSIQIQL